MARVCLCVCAREQNDTLFIQPYGHVYVCTYFPAVSRVAVSGFSHDHVSKKFARNLHSSTNSHSSAKERVVTRRIDCAVPSTDFLSGEQKKNAVAFAHLG